MCEGSASSLGRPQAYLAVTNSVRKYILGSTHLLSHYFKVGSFLRNYWTVLDNYLKSCENAAKRLHYHTSAWPTTCGRNLHPSHKHTLMPTTIFDETRRQNFMKRYLGRLHFSSSFPSCHAEIRESPVRHWMDTPRRPLGSHLWSSGTHRPRQCIIREPQGKLSSP